MPTVVRTDRLSKDFSTGFWRPRPHRALDALSFEIPSGGVFGLLGPNGAGKSTTLKLLIGLLKPTSGQAEVLGRPPGDVGAHSRLGFLPENPTFYDHLTAEELIAYFAGLFGYQGVARVLDLVGLGADRRRLLREYSKGMVQRVGLAQALVNDPEFIMLDEPMSGLDPIGRRDVRELIFRLRDEGRTVLFSSHILSDAEQLCSRVGILAKGRLVAAGTVAELAAGAGDSRRGWEIVVAALPEATVARLGPRIKRATAIADGRYSLEIGSDVRPEQIVGDLTAAGATLVSVTPLGTTLEDAFLKALGSAEAPGGGPQGPGREVRR
jgi:ABC-2 type transport system ATP-binding protein